MFWNNNKSNISVMHLFDNTKSYIFLYIFLLDLASKWTIPKILVQFSLALKRHEKIFIQKLFRGFYYSEKFDRDIIAKI